MTKTDLHVHSKYSNHPSEWFLKRIGASESYTEPDFIYEKAKANGMNYVTITDHNNISGSIYLKQKYPHDVFTGVESTAYFPEDGTKIHILIYDISEKQFEIIEKIRKNIYDLRDYFKENDIIHSVAHATYSVNGTLDSNHLEKLILLFDYFEVGNGLRNEKSNKNLYEFLKTLTKENMEILQQKHNISPYSNNSWLKGYTAGSDDHAGIFIGKTYTESKCNNMNDFLNNLRNKKTFFKGNYINYKSFTFSTYKIAYDYAKSKSSNISDSFMNKLNQFMFEGKGFTKKDKIKLKFRNFKKDKNEDKLKNMLIDFINEINKEKIEDLETKLDKFYDKVNNISDEFIKKMVEAAKESIEKGDLYKLIHSFTTYLPGIFLYIPFVSSFKHLNENKEIINGIKNTLNKNPSTDNKNILWFTDTINDLNGVSVTLKKIGWLAYKKSKNLKIISSLLEKEINDELPPNLINLKPIVDFKLPHYEEHNLNIPSILSALKEISLYDVDEIYISTPGPIGLIGLLISKLTGIKSYGVFHTDFTEQVKKIITSDDSPYSLVEKYNKWFYSEVDEIKVPTNEYISVLKTRGFSSNSISIFKKGIDFKNFYPIKINKSYLKTKYNIEEGINLIYTGRISKDKNLEFLIDLFEDLQNSIEKINLIFVGDGPDYEELKNSTINNKNIYFIGRVKNEVISIILCGSDLLLFPSVIDTFGMTVLEAQACGIPAIVSDAGGAKEIVINNKTGYVIEALNKNLWLEKINLIISYIKNNSIEYKKMKNFAHIEAKKRFNWDLAMKDIFDKKT